MSLKTLLSGGDTIARLESKLAAAAEVLADAQTAANEAQLAVELSESPSATAQEYGAATKRKLEIARQRHADIEGALAAGRQRAESEQLQAEAESESQRRRKLQSAHANLVKACTDIEPTLQKL